MNNKWLLILLAFAFLLSAAACGSSKAAPQSEENANPVATFTPLPTNTQVPTETPTPTITLTPQPTLTPTPTLPIPSTETPPQEAVLTALRYQCAHSFRVDSNISTQNEKANFTWEYVPPDRYHQKFPYLETIDIGPDRYVVLEEGVWNYMPPEEGSTDPANNTPCSEERFQTITNVTLLNSETLDEKPTMVYSFESLGISEDPKSIVQTKIWISLETGLVLRSESKIVDQGTTLTTLHIYTYDPNIKIEAPVEKPK